MQGQISGSTAAAIAESVRDLVAVGDFQPGDSLPPIRTLASDLDVNRNTVATAYRQMVSMGLAVARSRAGRGDHRTSPAGHRTGPSSGGGGSGQRRPRPGAAS